MRGLKGQFEPGKSGNPCGRPKGVATEATRRRKELLDPILPDAITKLHEGVRAGEKWAIEMTISYSLPKPKPVDIDEMAEFEERLKRLEQQAGDRHA